MTLARCRLRARRASRGVFAFGDLAGEVCAGGWVVAGLDDGDAVERGVELSVAAAVEAVAAGGLA
jgi:hypothetical protein